MGERSTNRNESRESFIRASLKASASLVAVSSLLVSGTAFAQDDEDDDDTIIVTGIRASLANAQDIKRDSDTVVDAITAEDIGALPDRSVTEALQRVPGVAINRFAGSNDPDHFSVEGSGVVVRGLNFVRGEFNGRDAFSANGGRQLGFSDVPAELMGSVIVAKNMTAEMIEGGLAGTVNLNTRVPFDQRGFHWGFTAEMNYGDMAKEWTPNVSGLITNTWDTDSGTWGLLAAVSYSQVMSRSDGLQIANFQPRDGVVTAGSNGSGDVTRAQLPDAMGNLLGGPGNPYYAPLGGQFRIQEFDRERMGIAAAAQYENIDQTVVATLQYFRAETSNDWGEYTFEAGPDLAEYNTFPAAGTGYDFDSDNVFESGFITLPGTGWRSGDSGGEGARVPSGGIQQSLARRQQYTETLNQDFGFNFKYTPSERWAFNFDAQYTEATTDQLDVSVFGSNFADYEIDLNGDLPTVIPHRPQNTEATWASPNAMTGISDQEYFGSNMFTFWRAAMDHIEQSEGHEVALKGDVQYTFDEGSFLRRLKFGARWSDRDQTVRYTTYNWGRLSEVWGGNGGSAVHFDEFGTANTSFYDFPDFFRNETPGPIGQYYYNGDLIGDYDGSADFFYSVDDYYREGQDGAAGGTRGWFRLSDRAGAINGTPFLPSDIQIVSEDTKAAYLMASFGSDQYGDYPILSGNIGVRFVHTELTSNGSVAFPAATLHGNGEPFEEYCGVEFIDPDGPEGPLPPQPADLPAICDLGPAGFADAALFANGGSDASDVNNRYSNWLPSLNLKLELNEELQLRFAGSRAMARPDFRYGRNYVTIGFDNTTGRFSATSGNPFLKPAVASQFDLSLEWYFDEVGSLTVTGFYKSVSDFFYSTVSQRTFTNNGSTQLVDVRGPANFEDENGEVKGFEVTYQQTYDFLPGILSGLGFSGNYTYIDSKGVPNANIGGIENVGQASNLQAGNLPLEQLSKHNFNATLFYEQGPLSMRASYNWRSEFLLTSRDVIFPYYPVYNDSTGQLDASIFYSITPNIKLAVQATNLTNEVTTTLQQISEDGLLRPRSYFMNDRRFSFGVRASF